MRHGLFEFLLDLLGRRDFLLGLEQARAFFGQLGMVIFVTLERVGRRILQTQNGWREIEWIRVSFGNQGIHGLFLGRTCVVSSHHHTGQGLLYDRRTDPVCRLASEFSVCGLVPRLASDSVASAGVTPMPASVPFLPYW